MPWYTKNTFLLKKALTVTFTQHKNKFRVNMLHRHINRIQLLVSKHFLPGQPEGRCENDSNLIHFLVLLSITHAQQWECFQSFSFTKPTSVYASVSYVVQVSAICFQTAIPTLSLVFLVNWSNSLNTFKFQSATSSHSTVYTKTKGMTLYGVSDLFWRLCYISSI